MTEGKIEWEGRQNVISSSYVIQHDATSKRNSHLNEANMLLNSMLITTDCFHQ